MNFRWFPPPRRFSVYSPECETAPAPSSLSKGGAFSVTPPLLLYGSLAASRLALGGPWALRPHLTTGLPFSLAHTNARADLH